MRLRALLVCIAAVASSLSLVTAASAHKVSLVLYSGEYIDGSGSTYVDANGETQPYLFSSFLNDLAIHQNNGHLLVYDNGYVKLGIGDAYRQGIISQFTGSGIAEPFTSLNHNTITGITYYGGHIAVDNSATPTNGNFYITAPGEQTIRGFAESGAELGGNFPIPNSGTACGIAVDPGGNIWVVDSSDAKLIEYDSGGTATGTEFPVGSTNPCALAIDGAGNFYVGGENGVRKFNSSGTLEYQLTSDRTSQIATDPSNGDVYIGHGNETVSAFSSTGNFETNLEPGPEVPDYPGLRLGGIAVNGSNHEVYVVSTVNYGGTYHVEIYRPTGELTVPDTTTGGAESTPATATLHGTINADGVETTLCEFEWGPETENGRFEYSGGVVPCQEGNAFGGSSDNPVSGELPTLTSGVTYHYRLVASNANGIKSYGQDQSFKPQGPPEILNETVGSVNTDSAVLGASIYPGGKATTYHFEVGTDTSYGLNIPEPASSLSTTTADQTVSAALGATLATKLAPNTTYHYRVVAENSLGKVTGADQTFRTFASPMFAEDGCGNARARQQTGAALLDDCRAYELVSAADAGGYDVQSDLVSGQNMLVARPAAHDKLLYSLHFGKVPGVAGSPTNLGLDPYVASRGPNGWTTSYVGLPADRTPSSAVFGSPLAGSDSGLTTFAFGGAQLCSPCFEDGSTGIPVRMPDGSLVQGMKGSLDPGPGAGQAGYVGKAVSADGSHLVFGSTAQFEPEGNSNGDVTIYERNLLSETTEVVSKTPGGATMTASGIAELDVSSDGSRVLIGKAISTDAAGNTYWHPYMYMAKLGKTIDLAPTTTSGVLYAGMTADGSKVFFTSPDRLTSDDLDNSADLYEASIDGENADLRRVSEGVGAGNANSCSPSHTVEGAPWNNVAGVDNCDVLALAGGAGIASGNGTVYFLSPEKLDGSGTSGAPNLFVARPGSAPTFIATLEPNSPAVRNARLNNEVHSFADLQTTPDGAVAVFASRLPLTGYPVAGHSEIYRYEQSRGLECVSCAPTRATATGDATLSGSGLNLTDDGRVFFTSPEQLVLRDTNGRSDAYEWENGEIQLISTGADRDGSGLLSVSSDGLNAFFFTRQTIVHADENGRTMKIYDAREGGGFPYNPPPVPCAASDECHGPGTAAPAPSIVGTFRGSGGNLGEPAKAGRCRKGQTKRHGRCVGKKRRGHRHHSRQGKGRHR